MTDSADNGGGRYWNPNWEVDQGKLGDLTRAELLVKDCLTRHAGRNGEAYPSVPRIAKLMKLSDRSVQRALRGLEAHGLTIAQTDKKGGRGRSVHYKLLSHTWKKFQGKGK